MTGVFRAAVSVVILGLAVAGSSAAAQKPNLLFIMTDQQRWDTLSYSGNRSIATPNLDVLARAVILTGKTTETVGIVKSEDYGYEAFLAKHVAKVGSAGPGKKSMSAVAPIRPIAMDSGPSAMTKDGRKVKGGQANSIGDYHDAVKDIGIRDLKARLSDLVRQVSKNHATYTLTRRGRAVGVLAPSNGVAREQARERLMLLAEIPGPAAALLK